MAPGAVTPNRGRAGSAPPIIPDFGSAFQALSEGEDPNVHQKVNVNFDDDNGSPIHDFIPEVRDFDVGYTPGENDLVQLILVWNNPPAPPTAFWTDVEYRVEVAYSGYGRIRVWDSPDKLNEIPLDEWTDQSMIEGCGMEIMPILYVEGIEPSQALEDVTINVACRKWTSENTIFEATYKPIKLTVTPALLDMYVTTAERPEYRFGRFGGATDDPTQATWISAHIEIEAWYVPPYGGLRGAPYVGFIQFITGHENQLVTGGENAAISFVWGPNVRLRILHPLEQPGPNTTYPFIDLKEGESLPFYEGTNDESYEPTNYTDGTAIIIMDDWPGFQYWSSMTEVHFSMFFRTYFAAMSPDGETYGPVVYPYGSLDWVVEFYFTDWAQGEGMRANLSLEPLTE